MKVYQKLAQLVVAITNCRKSGNVEWEAKHTARAELLVEDFLPRGSGIDNGTKLDLEKSTGEKLILRTAFHHMDQHGGYDGWTEHAVTVWPSLSDGIILAISGRDRNDIKDYLGEVYDFALRQEVSCDYLTKLAA